VGKLVGVAQGIYLVAPERLGVDGHGSYGKSDQYRKENGNVRGAQGAHQAA
jgi:hypothetical protein